MICGEAEYYKSVVRLAHKPHKEFRGGVSAFVGISK